MRGMSPPSLKLRSARSDSSLSGCVSHSAERHGDSIKTDSLHCRSTLHRSPVNAFRYMPSVRAVEFVVSAKQYVHNMPARPRLDWPTVRHCAPASPRAFRQLHPHRTTLASAGLLRPCLSAASFSLSSCTDFTRVVWNHWPCLPTS